MDETKVLIAVEKAFREYYRIFVSRSEQMADMAWDELQPLVVRELRNPYATGQKKPSGVG